MSESSGTPGANRARGSLAVFGGPRVAQLQNENGVIIQVHGVQIGLEVNLNLAAMTTAMK
jgi:hypothetical protein